MSNQPFLGLHHFALRSSDITRSAAFFEELGFHQVHNWHLPDYAIDRAVMMQAPDKKSWIELFDLDAEIPMQGTGAKSGQDVVTGALAHVCLTVENLTDASDRIISAGAVHLSGPHSLVLGEPEVHVRNAIFRGPAGEVIELLEPVNFPGDRPET